MTESSMVLDFCFGIRYRPAAAMVKRTAMLLVVEVAAITARMMVGRRDIVDLVVSVGVGLSGGGKGGDPADNPARRSC